MFLVVKRGGVRQHLENASRGHGRTRAPGQVRSAYSRGPGQPRAVPCLLARHPSPPLFLCCWTLRHDGKVTKNLGLPSCASASNVPSVSHCCWTWASSLRRASLRVLDFGGAGGVAMVSRAFFMLANWRGALCVTARWRVAQAQRWRARKRLSVICSNCRRDLCSQAQAMQPADCDRLQKLAAASVLQTLARFCPSNSSIDSYAAAKAAP